MTLIDKAEALAKCNTIAEEARSYGMPQMAMGAFACMEAIAALPARGVGVRCLVWEDFDGLGAKASAFYQANYLIQWWKGEGRYEVALSYPGYQTGYDGVRWHDTLEAAKAAAQADYEARILAALELPTSLQKVQRTLAPTDAAQAPFRMEDMTLADLMRDQLYEEATTPATGAEQAREAALREAAEFIRQDNFDATVRFDPKRHDGLRAWIRDQQASGILALIGERT